MDDEAIRLCLKVLPQVMKREDWEKLWASWEVWYAWGWMKRYRYMWE